MSDMVYAHLLPKGYRPKHVPEHIHVMRRCLTQTSPTRLADILVQELAWTYMPEEHTWWKAVYQRLREIAADEKQSRVEKLTKDPRDHG